MVKLKFKVDAFNINHWISGNGNPVIDISRALTIQQRRLHRQCKNYKVLGGYIRSIDSNGEYHGANIKLNTAFDNWTTRAAIKRGRNHFLAMYRELFKNNPALKPKWFDYKLMLHANQSPDSDDANGLMKTLMPLDANDNQLPHQHAGLNYSEFVTENSERPELPAPPAGQSFQYTDKDEFQTHLVGNHTTSSSGGFISVGLIKSWLDSRPKPPSMLDFMSQDDSGEEDDDRMMADPLNMLFNDGGADDELIENLTNIVNADGDADGDHFSPYDPDQIVNAMQTQAVACTTAAAPIAYFTGFTALCGLVEVDVQNLNSGDTLEITLEVDPRGEKI